MKSVVEFFVGDPKYASNEDEINEYKFENFRY